MPHYAPLALKCVSLNAKGLNVPEKVLTGPVLSHQAKGPIHLPTGDSLSL